MEEGPVLEPFQFVPIARKQEIEVVPQTKFCGIMDSFHCGECLICHDDSISEDGSSSGAISTGSFELPSVGVYESEEQLELMRAAEALALLRIKQRVRRARSAAPLYLI